jgi:tagatose-1,6-bisphosphate aldolase non-catalytic subunit AgaZ/GatZ
MAGNNSIFQMIADAYKDLIKSELMSYAKEQKYYMTKWSLKDLEIHIKANLNDSYSAAIVISAFFKKVFGRFPDIGLSGVQAECSDVVLKKVEEILNEP